MPRDGSGNYTLPSGNPVSAGATIESNWANSTMDDLAVAMTDSLSRTGAGSMLVPFQNIDGTESLPGITWAQEPSSGFFRETTGDMRWTILSVAQGRFNNTNQLEVFRNAGFRRVPDVVSDETILGQWTFANGIAGDLTFTGQALGEDGDASAPTYSFTNDPDTGMWLGAVGLLNFAVGAVDLLTLQASRAEFGMVIRGVDGTSTTPAYSFVADDDTGFQRLGDNVAAIVTGGANRFEIRNTDLRSNQVHLFVDGSAANPGIAFLNGSTTGFSRPGSTSIGVSYAGVQKYNLESDSLRGPIGSAAFPGYAFLSDTDMGMFRDTVNRLSFGTEGVLRFFMEADRIQSQIQHRFVSGSAGTPGIAFASDTNMGMYRESSNFLAFAVGGVRQARVTTNSWQFFQQILGPVGSTATPTYSFTGDGDTGMYWGASGVITFSSNNVLALSIGNSGIFAGTGFRFQADGANVAAATPAYTFSNDTDTGMYRVSANALGFSAGAGTRMTLNALSEMDLFQNGATGGITQNFKNSAGVTAWAIQYEGTAGFQPQQFSISRFNASTGTFIDIPVAITTAGQMEIQDENAIRRKTDTAPRTGFRYLNAAGQPMWAIYLGTTTTNTLAFQRYNSSGTFQDIPLSIRQLNGLIRMSTLPTSSAGLISGELWRNPVSPGFVAIV